MRMVQWLLLATGLCSVLLPPAWGAGHLNVIVILTDDQGYGDLSCHGNPHLQTPNLDSLKKESTALDRFFVSPTCSPTRAALLTGRHEFEVGVSHTVQGRSLLRPGIPTLPEVLSAAGYRTGIFGKWHLGDAYPCRPEDRGFDHVFIHGGGGIGQTPDAWGNTYYSPKVRTNDGWVKTDGYCTDVFFSEAASWMKSQVEAEKPFFMWLATNAPHSPFHAPKGTEEKFLKMGLKPSLASFYAMIENIDQNVGTLMEQIREQGIEQDTIVVFMSDNGSTMADFNAGMRGKKGSPHEGGVRVPCFIKWPGKIEKNRKVESSTAHIDFMPSILGLCGVEMPAEVSGSGLNLSASLLGNGPFPKERTFFTHVGRWPGNVSPERRRSRGFSVRTDRWRLVGLDLFDMKKDPGQKESVSESHLQVMEGLLADYGRWWDGVRPSLYDPVRYRIGNENAPLSNLTCHDWWPSLESDGNFSIHAQQGQIREYLEKFRVAKTRNLLPERCGHWKLDVARSGNYKLSFSMLPPDAPAEDVSRLGVLKSGVLHVRTGRHELQMEVLDGATRISTSLDLDKGPLDLESWVSGQLPGERRLGMLFATVEYMGEKKVELPEIQVMPQEEAERMKQSQEKKPAKPDSTAEDISEN